MNVKVGEICGERVDMAAREVRGLSCSYAKCTHMKLYKAVKYKRYIEYQKLH